MRTKALRALERELAKAARPPERLSYSEWAAKNFRLSGNSASPGRFRPWKTQRGLLDAFGDPLLQRIDVLKSARCGYTTCLVAAIAADAVNDPSATIVLMPTDDDARGIVVDEIDPAFRDTPALQGLMRVGRFDGRNTLTNRTMAGGGSLKVLSARAPRNLRRHTARRVYSDEVDAMEITPEGDPLLLVERRTISYADRKLVSGSTPTDEETSIIVKRYSESDQRVFEVPCPHCGDRFEILWEHISWPPGRPEEAVCICPHCGAEIEEKLKPAMEEAGEWRATHPEVKGHAGFRLNALVSLFANAAWGVLAAEYEKAKKNGPSDLQVFYNTVLGQVWSSSINQVAESELMSRREAFGLSLGQGEAAWNARIPRDVLYITVGVDVQVDRLECVILGWSEEYRWFLGHHVIWGATNLESTWDELDAFLSTKWPHPLGAEIGIEAAAVDSGDGNRTQQVYDFCMPRMSRKIVAIKGVQGSRPLLERSKSNHRKYRGAVFWRVGVDQVKTDIVTTLPLDQIDDRGQVNRHAFRFSDTLEEEWFRQITAERRIVTYVRGRPTVEFKRVENRRAEALDAAGYAIAVRQLCRFEWDARRVALTGRPAKPKTEDLAAIVSRLHG